ncbi:MAG: GC-type dockerin domain-anchored protein [Phycisphaerales bacterium]
MPTPTRSLAFFAAILVVLLLPARLLADSLTFTGGGDGFSWNAAANWSGGAVPTINDDVVLPAGGFEVQINFVAASARSITSFRAFRVREASLTLAGDLTLNGQLMVLRSGTVTFADSPSTIGGNGEIRFETGASYFFVPGGSSLTVGPDVALAVQPFTNSATSLTVAGIAGSVPANVIVRGRVTAATAYGTVDFADSQNMLTLTNLGVIESVTGGSVRLMCVWTNSGTFRRSANGRLDLWGRYSDIGNVQGTGGVVMMAGTVTPSPQCVLPPDMGEVELRATVVGGRLAAGANSSFAAYDGSRLEGVTLAAPMRVGVANVSNSGPVGILRVVNGLNLDSCTVRVLNGNLDFVGGVQNLGGTGEIVGGIYGSRMRLQSGVDLTIGPGVTIRHQADPGGVQDFNIMFFSGPGGDAATLINQGVIRAASALGKLTIDGDAATITSSFRNEGLVEARDGAWLTVNCAWNNLGTVSASTGGIIQNNGSMSQLGTVGGSGGELRLFGSMNGPINLTAMPHRVVIGGRIIGGRVTIPAGANVSFDEVSVPPGTNGGMTWLDGVTIAGDWQINSGDVVLLNTVTLDNATVRLRSGGLLRADTGTATLAGNGAVIVEGSSHIDVVNGAQLTIAPGILIRTQTVNPNSLPGLYFAISNSTGVGTSRLINQGEIRISGAGHYGSIGGGVDVGPNEFVNQGLVSIDQGAGFVLDAPWINAGTLSVATGANLTLGGTYTSLGNLTNSGGTLSLQGIIRAGGVLSIGPQTGPFTLTAILNGVRLESTGGVPWVFTGSITFDGVTLAAPARLTAGYIAVRNGLAFDGGSMRLEGGTVEFHNGSSQNITGTGEFVLVAATNQIAYGAGRTLMVGTGITVRSEAGPGAATLRVGSISGAAATATLVNQGSIRADALNRTIEFSSPVGTDHALINQGQIGVSNGGTMLIQHYLATPGTLSLSDTGTLELGWSYTTIPPITRSGGTLRLGGTFTPNSGSFLTQQMGPVVLVGTLAGGSLLGEPGTSLPVDGATINNTALNVPVIVPPSKTLTIKGTCQMGVAGSIRLQGATLNIDAPNCTLSGSGSVIAEAGTANIMELLAGADLFVGPNFTILTESTGGTFCTLDVRLNQASAANTATIINDGAWRARGAGRRISFSNVTGSNNTFTHRGFVEAWEGAIVSMDINWTNATGVWILDSTSDLRLGGTYTSIGVINRSGGTLRLGGTPNLGPLFTISNTTTGGPVRFDVGNASNLTIATTNGLGCTIDGGTFTNCTFNCPTTVPGAPTLTGCTIGAPMQISGSLNVNTSLTLANDAAVSLLGSSLIFRPNTVLLSGAGRIVGGAGTAATIQVLNGCDLTIGPNILVQTDPAGGSAGSLTFRLSSVAGNPPTVINQGTIRAGGGNQSLSMQYVSGNAGSMSNSGRLEVYPGASLLLGVNTTNSGQIVIDPAGLLSVPLSRTLTLGAGGRLVQRVGGAGAGRIVTNGFVALGGTLQVEHAAGYAPQRCNPALELMSAVQIGVLSGNFAAIELPAPVADSSVRLQRTDSQLSFVASSAADVAGLGGVEGPDGQQTADDVVVFLSGFFAQALGIADIAELGGMPGSDGQLTPDDLIYFLDQFFRPCGS